MDLQLGEVIGTRYRLDERIGQGAMGVVYRGWDTARERPVAVKALRPSLVAEDPDLLARFEREGEALRRLNHPNIVQLLDTVSAGERHYLIMEYVPGGDLRGPLSGGKQLPLSQVLNIALDLADALTRAHRLDIIHRDLKPANILLAADGSPRLSDFGIAHMGGLPDLTQTGVLVGTLSYLSPEACQGQPLDPRADIWSFGVLIYEMLTGRRPFAGDSVAAVLTAVLTKPLPDIRERRPDIPEPLEDLLYRMLAKNREDRIPSVRLVGAALEAVLAARAISDSDIGPPMIRFAADTTGSRSQTKHNLPAQTTPFVGREAELAELSQLLAAPATRLVTILAPGGMGKTRLGLEVAGRLLDSFGDGVFFVPLSPLGEPAGIITAIAEATDFALQANLSAQEQVLGYLANKHLLLILDNFEHLMDGIDVVAAILAAAPQVSLLVTSRVRLNLGAETVFTIGGMDFPEWETPADALNYSAVQLFLQSAGRTRADFILGPADLGHVARITRLVDGMPLGLLLAAAWVDVLSLAEIAAEISQSAAFLESDQHDLPPRQRSMQAVFDYSWQLLTDAERDAFARLSVFRASFSRDAARAITGVSIRLLHRLVQKSLLLRGAESGRFAVHELLRQFSVAHLEKSGAAAEMAAAHSRYYLRALAALEDDVQGTDQLNALNNIEADFANVAQAWRAAVAAGDAELVDTACRTLALYCLMRSRLEELWTLLTLAVERFDEQNHPLLYYRILSRARLHFTQTPAQVLERLAWVRQHGEPRDIIAWLWGYFIVSVVDPDTARAAIPLLEEALALAREHGFRYDEAGLLHNLGFSYSVAGEPERYLAYTEAALSVRRDLGDRYGLAAAVGNIGYYYLTTGDYELAQRYLTEAVAVYHEIGSLAIGAYYQAFACWAAYFRGDMTQATTQVNEALKIGERLGNDAAIGAARLAQAVLALHNEAYQTALDWLAPLETLNINLAVQSTYPSIRAPAYAGMGDLARAWADAEPGLRRQAVAPQQFSGIVPSLVLVAQLFWLAEDGENAVTALACAESHEMNHTDWVSSFPPAQRLEGTLRAALPAGDFDRAWAAGAGQDGRAIISRCLEIVPAYLDGAGGDSAAG